MSKPRVKEEADRPVAMVLAAGHATRLRPLTDEIAKAVVPFLNRPLLDYTLQWLAEEGLSRVVINLHHAGDSIRDRYGAGAFGLHIEYSPEARLLGSAGGPRAALARLGSRFLLVNGDVLTRLGLAPLLRHHIDSGALATLALYDGDQARDHPRVTADRGGRLLAFPGEPVTLAAADRVEGVFTGIQVVEREVIAPLPEGRPVGIVSPVYRELLHSGRELAAIPLHGAWYEVGDPARYLHGQLTALRRGDAPLALVGARRLADAGFVSDGAGVPPPGLQPPFLLGPGASVAAGAGVAGVVLGAKAVVEAESEVRDAVLWEGARVGRSSRLHEVIIMRGVSVPPGTVARRGIFSPKGLVEFPADAGLP